MAEDWGTNDPLADDEAGVETWGESDPVVGSEQDQQDWGIDDPVVEDGAIPALGATKPSTDIVQQYGEVSQRYNEKGKALSQTAQRFQQLSTQPERTPEEDTELTSSWEAALQGQADISKDAAELKRLQPQYDKYFADQKQARVDYIEDRRGSGVFGDQAAEALYDIDARAEQEYAQARTIEDTDKRKEAMAAIQAKYQAEEKDLTNQYVGRFKENETKINNAAEVIGQAFAKGQTVDQFLLETGADAEEFNELRDSLLNQDDPEKGRLFREARDMVDLADGTKKVGIVNNEIRVSPLHVWDAEGIKSEIDALDISDAKKRKTIATIPQMQQEAVKVELPFLQQVREFNNFVKDNNLEDVSPQRQISEWKNRNEGWLDQVGKLPAQVGIGLKTGTLGLLEAGQAIVGATALTMGAQNFADPFLDSATKTSDDIQNLTRISKEIGGPTFAAELAAVVPQIVAQIGTGGAVGFGGAKLGLKPKVVSNIGFGSSVGTAFAQSYGGVLSSAFQTLEKEKIDAGMDPVQARAEAVKEAQLPAALSGLSTAVLTTIGGKRGAEAVFSEGVDGIKAKLNTAAFRAELPKLMPDIVKGMRNEGYEEFADQLAQGIIEQFSFNPELATSDIINNAFKALAIGGITGGTVEGLKYGFDYMKAPKEMARREASMASIRQSIADAEQDISNISASSPIGAEFQREYDATLPSDEAAALGGVAVDRTRMSALQSERQQISELLEDDTISRVARNQLEGKLASADLSYYNEILVPARRNVVNEQMVDQLDNMVASDQTKDGIRAMAKIANGLDAESLTGRERVAVGITSVGGGRFLPSRKNPMVEVDEAGQATVTEAGRLMAENVGMVPLVRMIGLSETTRAKQAEMERVVAEAEARKAQQEAKDTSESEEAKRYGPASAEALKQQVTVQPPAPEKESNVRLAQLLKEQEEAARLGEEAVTRAVETRFIESFRSSISEAIIPTAERAATIDLNAFRDVINSIAQEIDKGTFNIELIEQGEFKNILPEQAFTTVVEAFKENPQRALNALRAFGDEVENAVKEFGGGAAGEPPENLEPLLRVVRTEQTPEDVTALTEAGLIEIYKDQPVITEAGLAVIPEAERPRLNPEARKIQIDTGANEVVAEAISKGLRIGVDQVGPNVTLPQGWTLDGDIYVPPAPPVEPPVAPPTEPPVQPPVTPPVTPPPVAPAAGAITEEQANSVIKAAQEERASKPAPTIGKTRWGPQSVAPKQAIGKTAREALVTASRLNLSKIAQSDPNEIMMQDVAAILAELDMPVLDLEPIVSLSSLRKKGRARRWGGVKSVIGLPSTVPMPVEIVVHEIGHTITADQVSEYLPRAKFARGKGYLDAINKVIADPKTPEPISRLFSLYVSTIEQLGIADQYFATNGIAGGRSADASKALGQRAQAKGLIRKDIKSEDFYGLANLEEFVSQTFSEPSFRELLKGLKDPNNPRQSLWQAFVDAIQKILQLPKGSMAAAVIEASVDVGMLVEPARVKARGAAGVTPAPAPRPDMLVDDAFSENAFKGKEGFKSRSKIVKMSIDDFLKIATTLPREQSAEAQKAFDAGIKWESIPYLSVVTNTDGVAKILGHEGRHRALVLKRAGYTEMPVEIRDRNIRWSEQTDPKSFDYSEVFPTQLEAEKSDTRIPFPFTREQGVEKYSPTDGDMAPEPRAITPQQDRDYLDAVERGDLDAAQRVVDEAAKRAGWYEKTVYHGIAEGVLEGNSFNVDKLGKNTGAASAKKGFFFAGNPETSKAYVRKLKPSSRARILADTIENLGERVLSATKPNGKNYVYENTRKFILKRAVDELRGDEFEAYLGDPYANGSVNELLSILSFDLVEDQLGKNHPLFKESETLRKDLLEDPNHIGTKKDVLNLKLKMENPLIKDFNGMEYREESYASVIDRAKKGGYDSVILKNTYDGGPLDDIYVVFNPEQIKSAEPVTYDDQGSIIPLSQRFQPEEADIRYNPLGYDITTVVGDIKAGRTDGPLRAINNVVKESTELRDRIKRESQKRQKPRARGQAPILERIAKERSSGKISEETAQALIDFVNTIRPDAIGDTAISIRGAGGVSNFDFGDNLVSFYLTQDQPEMGARIGIHEFWHGLSRFLPKNELAKMSEDYTRELIKFIDANPWFLAFVGRYSLTPEQFEAYKIFNPKEAETKLSPVFDANGEITKYNIRYDKDNYRYIMLDEWIAENMTDLVRQRQGIPDTFLGKLAKVFIQFLDLIESKLGLDPYESFYQLATDPEKKLQLYRTESVARPFQIYQPQTYDYAGDAGELVRYNTLAPEPETSKTVEMSLEMEKERTFQLLGERLYTAELPKVVVKETVQNGFDAIKDAEETGEIPRGSGVIAYSRKELEVNGQKIVRMMFSDNGGGMTPEILQNAFFTVGGTFKRSGKGSGGFGLAKLGMFMSADRVMVETVRDGVVTTADLTKQELVDKKFSVNVAEEANRKNGTMVILEFKKSITRSDGKTVDFENPYTVFDRLIHHDLTIIDDNYGSYQNELIGLFQNESSGLWTLDEIKERMGKKPYTFEDFVKDAPNVETFEQDFVIAGAKKPIKVRVASSRLGLKRKDGKAKWNEDVQIAGATRNLKNHNMSVYSNGLFQFEKENLKIDPMKLWGGDPLPYNIVVDIDAGGLDAASLAYPFTNSREDFQNGVVKDYINKLLNDIRVKERQRQFDQEFNLLTDISGGKPRKDSPTLYNNTTIVPQPFEQKFLEDLTKAVFDVADDLVVALRKGNEDNILEDDWYKVKSQKGSVAPTGKSEEDSLDYFYGVGISKNWGGVNTSRDPVSVLVNPIYKERVDEYARTEFGRRILARTIAKTLIHEINHHLHRNEGSDFTFFILQNEAYLGEVGAIQSAVDKILPVVNQHPDAIISLKNKFRTAETKDTDNELTGEQYERSSKEPDGQPRTTVVGGDRVVQQPSGEVSPRPTSEEDGEQTGAYLPSSITAGGRQDAGVGEGISFGDALSGSLVENQAQINEEGISRAEGAEPAPEEEFEIVPERVEDQIEGTPEAATIKVMGQAFQMANEQSAAAGTPQGTLPLETITSAWMNSGRDVETLENAIIRYTNLEPEAAATLAEAIGKQVKIQRGIMEISDAASRRKAEKEKEPEIKPYSFAERIAGELPRDLRNKINLAYEVLRNEVSVEEANRVMSGLTVDEAIRATEDMTNGVSFPVRSMMAQIVLRKIMAQRKSTKGKKGKEADYKAAVEAHVKFLDFTNDYFKELGQGVQAIARFSDLGADGVLLKIRRDVDKAISKHITNRRGQIDKIKRDVEDADSTAFDAAIKSNKSNIDKTAKKAGEQEAKKLTIEEQAQKLAIRAAKKVTGEEVRRRQPDPLSDLVNSHLRRYNANFIAEATAMGVSPVTAQAIEDSAIKLRDSRQAAKSERERFKEMQDERMKVKRELARENKYIYGQRPTIWENYQDMFSERLARRLMRDPKNKVPPSLLLFTDRLTENLLGFVPEAERQTTTQRSFQAMVEDALNNKEKYQEAFNRALEDISFKVMELEVREAAGEKISSTTYKKAVAAQEFLERLEPIIQQFPVSDKLIARFVNQKMKAMGESLVGRYNDWYRSSRKTRIEIEKALAEKLVADMNVGNADAVNLSRAIIKDFRAKAEERREKALARFKKPKEKTKRLAQSPLKKFFELVNIGAMSDKDAYEVMAHRFELPTWDEKFAKQIEEMALIIEDMPEGLERRRLTRNMMAEIARRKGFSLSDLGSGFFYSNMLSSVETFLINLQDTLIGNFVNGLASSVADKDFTRMSGLISGYRKGWIEAVKVFQTGLRINMPRLEEKTPLTVELINYGKKGGVALESTEGMNAIAKTLLESPPAKALNLWKYVTRIMEATDALNYAASSEGQRYAEAAKMARDEGLEGKAKQKRINQILNLGDDVYQAALKQAEKEGYTGTDAKFRAMEIQDNEIDAELREKSFDRALTDVYRNMPTGLAGFLAAKFNNTVMAISNPWVRNAIKLFTAPFVITPTNLFNRWLDYSPYGYKRLFYGSGNLLDKDTPYYVAPPKVGSAEFYTQALKASSSVMVMGLAAGLVKAGLLVLRGIGPSDEEERKQWLADGNRPHTFSFMGGPQISYQFTPWALVLSWMSNYLNWDQYNAKDDATYTERGIVAMTLATGVIMDLPFFAGPAEFMEAMQKTKGDPVATLGKYTEGKMGMVFPNIVRQIDRIFDPTMYDSQGLKGIIIDQMPFARRLGTQRVNLFGDPIGEDKPVMDRVVGRIISFPTKPSRESRILAKYDIYPYMPSPKEAKALVDGEQAQMTEEQYNKFVQIVGKDVKKRINDLFDPDAEITEKERERGKKRISQIFERARARGVREVSTY